MSKYANDYIKKHYIQVLIKLKPDEKKRLDRILKKHKLSRRLFLLDIIERVENNEVNICHFED